MPIPEFVTGSLLDVKRLLAFKGTVNNLIFFDSTGTEIHRIDHFWHLELPRVKFGQAYESCRLTVVEDEEAVVVALDPFMTNMTIFRYEVLDENDVLTVSGDCRHYGIKAPLPGRNRIWRAELNLEAFSQNFFHAMGER